MTGKSIMGWIQELPEPHRTHATDFAKADPDYNMRDYHELLYDNPITAMSTAFIFSECGGFNHWNDIIHEHFGLK